MTFNINEFRTHIASQNEFSLSNKFNVLINAPDFLSDLGYMSQLTLACSIAELPGVDIAPTEFRHYGFIQRTPYHLNFAPVTLTFLCTGKMNEKKFFDAWMSGMIPFNSGMAEYPDAGGVDRKFGEITINQYDNMGAKVYSVTLKDAMPVSMQNLSLDWSNESIHHLPITFVYKKWITADIDVAPPMNDPVGAIVTDPSVPSTGKQNSYTNK